MGSRTEVCHHIAALRTASAIAVNSTTWRTVVGPSSQKLGAASAVYTPIPIVMTIAANPYTTTTWRIRFDPSDNARTPDSAAMNWQAAATTAAVLWIVTLALLSRT